MATLKSLMSFFLMCTYLVGFGHELIPHCHIHHHSGVLLASTHTCHHHEGQTNGEDHEAEFAIEHHDHLDDGVLDFVLCLLTEANHHSENTWHFHMLPDMLKSLKEDLGDAVKSFAFSAGPSVVSCDEAIIVKSIKSACDRSSLATFSAAIPRRGPPVHG